MKFVQLIKTFTHPVVIVGICTEGKVWKVEFTKNQFGGMMGIVATLVPVVKEILEQDPKFKVAGEQLVAHNT